jgi:hypothetical protein
MDEHAPPINTDERFECVGSLLGCPIRFIRVNPWFLFL